MDYYAYIPLNGTTLLARAGYTIGYIQGGYIVSIPTNDATTMTAISSILNLQLVWLNDGADTGANGSGSPSNAAPRTPATINTSTSTQA